MPLAHEGVERERSDPRRQSLAVDPDRDVDRLDVVRSGRRRRSCRAGGLAPVGEVEAREVRGRGRRRRTEDGSGLDHRRQDDRRSPRRRLEGLGRAEPGRLTVEPLPLDDRAFQPANIENPAVSPRQAEHVRARELDRRGRCPARATAKWWSTLPGLAPPCRRGSCAAVTGLGALRAGERPMAVPPREPLRPPARRAPPQRPPVCASRSLVPPHLRHRSRLTTRPSRLYSGRGPISTRRRYGARPTSTQALCPPRPIAFESATSTSASRDSFGT